MPSSFLLIAPVNLILCYSQRHVYYCHKGGRTGESPAGPRPGDSGRAEQQVEGHGYPSPFGTFGGSSVTPGENLQLLVGHSPPCLEWA